MCVSACTRACMRACGCACVRVCFCLCARLFLFLEKLKDPNVLETFQAMIGRKFAPLTIMSKEDIDIYSMITTFNTAVTATASEILGKHRQKKKPLITAEILDLCDKRRELRKKRFEPVSYTHLTLPTRRTV